MTGTILLIAALTLIVVAVSWLGRSRRRAEVLDLRERCGQLEAAVAQLSLTLASIDRELRVGGNPPGSISKVMPTKTLEEVARLRASLSELRKELDACPRCTGLFGFLQVDEAVATLASLKVRGDFSASEVEAFRHRVRSGWEAGNALP